ncbi:hypothetical protein RclHR1_05610003 [Rhizophagus clarus]|uniref:LamG domain-containing protein n=1 Tax=Rhizophagus clarus TaxID=94130 RepID=A0A2Z6RNG7_9GLOM|nr:hypothetical protein RclHR1_05610003 [Rhizophagus clarus]GES84560.1 LamG domain-containing protein [Rhizophagus clarus]
MSNPPTVKRITSYPPSYWSIEAPRDGIQVKSVDKHLNYNVNNVQKNDQWTLVSVLNSLSTNGGALIIFRIRVNSIANATEVKLVLPTGVHLRYTPADGFNYQWYKGGNFEKLSSSNIRVDKAWHTIVLSLTPQVVTLLEDGIHKFNWKFNVPNTVNPTFNMAISGTRSNLDIDIGDVYAIPPNIDNNIED